MDSAHADPQSARLIVMVQYRRGGGGSRELIRELPEIRNKSENS